MNYLLQHLLIESANRFPDHPAVVTSKETFTYRELLDRSTQIARILIEKGCRPGDRVGIYCDKSAASILSIYGILIAGCAYVPLDPSAPTDRLKYIVRNCGIRGLLLTASRIDQLSEVLPADVSGGFAVVVDADVDEEKSNMARVLGKSDILARSTAVLPKDPAIETDLAYILYTSGSTGNPKGVMISHLNALTFVRWAAECADVIHEDRVSNHAPLHFDLSIFDIFASSLAGATLYPVPPGASIFPMKMADWIAENRISVWYSVPSILSMMVRQGKIERHQFESLRTIVFAGEVFPVKYLRSWKDHLPRTRFFNWYGPTETNVVTSYEVVELSADQTEPVPIGTACRNMDVYAIGDDGQRVTSTDTEGQLIARGSCVAWGYWGDQERTMQSFEFAADKHWIGDRIYKTGDIVTIDENGDFIYVGRRDHMVKSRGYRIELGEIESALYRHGSVQEAVAIAVPDELIGSRILAYVIADKYESVSGHELENHLAAILPRYMIPEKIDVIEKMPKTSTGKISRPALIEAEKQRIN